LAERPRESLDVSVNWVVKNAVPAAAYAWLPGFQAFFITRLRL
jgi:hypothetical protein